MHVSSGFLGTQRGLIPRIRNGAAWLCEPEHEKTTESRNGKKHFDKFGILEVILCNKLLQMQNSIFLRDDDAAAMNALLCQ